jgi:hypothetical protein
MVVAGAGIAAGAIAIGQGWLAVLGGFAIGLGAVLLLLDRAGVRMTRDGDRLDLTFSKSIPLGSRDPADVPPLIEGIEQVGRQLGADVSVRSSTVQIVQDGDRTRVTVDGRDIDVARVLTTGREAFGTIEQVLGSDPNEDVALLSLRVDAPGHDERAVQVPAVVPPGNMTVKLVAGTTLPIRIDREHPGVVLIDWARA